MSNFHTNRGLRSYLHAARQLAIALSFTAFSLSAYSQKPIPSHYQSYKWSSASNTTAAARTTAKGGSGSTVAPTVNVPNAVWLRVYFEPVELAPGSYVLIKSIADGATQQMSGEQLADWGYSTAYFNGSQLDISLVKAPDDNAVLTIKEVEVGDLDLDMAITQSQCGSADNRTASSNKKIGRIVPVGCTGWIITNGKIVTAGHCVGSRMEILEFNVPLSNSNGTIVHPAPKDQYVIKQNSIQSNNSTSDWCVFTVNNNAETGKSPLSAQGASFAVEQVNSATTLRITGFGVDVGSANQTQQTHTGPYTSSTSSKIFYTVDTEGGNSGSPIINVATGKAIGVHTNGGCNRADFDFKNSGTNAKVTAFWNAMGLTSGRMSVPASDPALIAQSLQINERTFTFTKTELTPKDAIVRIFDRYGNLVRTANLKNGETQLSVNKEGIYIVSIVSEESVSAKQYYIR